MSSKDAKQVYRPFDSMTFTNEHCFLCGVSLADQASAEHVFPKWLLNRYNLWNERIALLNGTDLPYRQMTIPCCVPCNNNYLSSLERAIENAISEDYNGVAKLEEIKIFQWISKIFYGILFRELSLLADRRDPLAGFITTPEALERYKFLHIFLQSIRIPTTFVGDTPWSIFVVETHSYDQKLDFDYHDNIQFLTFSIRMGAVGIIACLQDNGSQKDMFDDYFNKFKDMKLHPIQFDELYAKVTYKASLMNRNPSYIINFPSRETEEITVITMPIMGMSSKPLYEDWEQRDYAYFLEHYWSKGGLTFDMIFTEPNRVLTYLENEKGEIHKLDPDGKSIS